VRQKDDGFDLKMQKSSNSIAEWSVLFGVAALAIATTNLLHLEQR
jgi:hypothetical protein